MAKSRNNYWVSPRSDGKWEAQKEGTNRAAGVVDTQKEAEDIARQILKNGPGGELITQGRDGQIKSKDTINAPDSCPPRDKEH